jgi:hypothetical protein
MKRYLYEIVFHLCLVLLSPNLVENSGKAVWAWCLHAGHQQVCLWIHNVYRNHYPDQKLIHQK